MTEIEYTKEECVETMTEVEYNEVEFKEAIEELVPAYHKAFVLNALTQDTEYDYENDIKQLTGEATPADMVRQTSVEKAPNEKSMFEEIKKETLDFFCSDSAKYASDRSAANITAKSIITAISSYLAVAFNVNAGAITGGVSIFVMIVLKIGKNAWCNIHYKAD